MKYNQLFIVVDCATRLWRLLSYGTTFCFIIFMYWQLCRNHELHYANSSTSFHDFIYFIELIHTAAVAEGDDWVSWRRRLRWLKESNALAEWDGCGGWRSRMRWLKESNAVTGGDECDSWRSRMQWPEETNAVAGGDGNMYLNRFYTIPPRDNNIKIVVFHTFTLRFSL